MRSGVCACAFVCVHVFARDMNLAIRALCVPECTAECKRQVTRLTNGTNGADPMASCEASNFRPPSPPPPPPHPLAWALPRGSALFHFPPAVAGAPPAWMASNSIRCATLHSPRRPARKHGMHTSRPPHSHIMQAGNNGPFALVLLNEAGVATGKAIANK
jgi:hypothetical protein